MEGSNTYIAGRCVLGVRLPTGKVTHSALPYSHCEGGVLLLFPLSCSVIMAPVSTIAHSPHCISAHSIISPFAMWRSYRELPSTLSTGLKASCLNERRSIHPIDLCQTLDRVSAGTLSLSSTPSNPFFISTLLTFTHELG